MLIYVLAADGSSLMPTYCYRNGNRDESHLRIQQKSRKKAKEGGKS